MATKTAIRSPFSQVNITSPEKSDGTTSSKDKSMLFSLGDSEKDKNNFQTEIDSLQDLLSSYKTGDILENGDTSILYNYKDFVLREKNKQKFFFTFCKYLRNNVNSPSNPVMGINIKSEDEHFPLTIEMTMDINLKRKDDEDENNENDSTTPSSKSSKSNINSPNTKINNDDDVFHAHILPKLVIAMQHFAYFSGLKYSTVSDFYTICTHSSNTYIATQKVKGGDLSSNDMRIPQLSRTIRFIFPHIHLTKAKCRDLLDIFNSKIVPDVNKFLTKEKYIRGVLNKDNYEIYSENIPLFGMKGHPSQGYGDKISTNIAPGENTNLFVSFIDNSTSNKLSHILRSKDYNIKEATISRTFNDPKIFQYIATSVGVSNIDSRNIEDYVSLICLPSFPVSNDNISKPTVIVDSSDKKKSSKHNRKIDYNPFKRDDQALTEIARAGHEILKYIKDSTYTENKTNFIKIGMSIWNFRRGNMKDFEVWANICKRTLDMSRFDCFNLWVGFCYKNYRTFSTIAYFARKDDPDGFAKWNEDWFRDAFNGIEKFDGVTDSHAGDAFFRLFYDRFIYDSNTSRWYEFDDSCWRMCSSAEEIINKISTFYATAVNRYVTALQDKINSETNKEKKHALTEMIKYMTTLHKDSMSLKYKNTIAREIKGRFMCRDFEQIKDTMPHVTGILNGVIETELKTGKISFRKGMPDDYITKQLNAFYDPSINIKHPRCQKIIKCLLETYNGNQEELEADLTWISSFFDSNRHKKVRINWGKKGNNGKTTRNNLLYGYLGSYMAIGSPKALGNEKSGDADPELADSIGCRLLVFNEPDRYTKIRAAIIRILSGGDKSRVRKLYSNGNIVTIDAHVEINTNQVPEIPDGGSSVQNRLMLTEYGVQFLETGVPESVEEQRKQRIYPADSELMTELESYGPFMLYIAMEYWPKYCKNGIKHTKSSYETTKRYWKTTDIYQTFIDRCVEIVETKEGKRPITIDVETLYGKFADWFDAYGFHETRQCPNLSVFEDEIKTSFGLKDYYSESKKVFINVRIKTSRRKKFSKDDKDFSDNIDAFLNIKGKNKVKIDNSDDDDEDKEEKINADSRSESDEEESNNDDDSGVDDN